MADWSGNPSKNPISGRREESQLLFKEFALLDDALSWARHLDASGRIPLLIEGDDGTRMDRRAIINALRWVCASNSIDSQLSGGLGSASEPDPLSTGPFREAVPVVADDIPVDHRPFPAGGVRGRRRMAGIIKVGSANGEYDAEKNTE